MRAHLVAGAGLCLCAGLPFASPSRAQDAGTPGVADAAQGAAADGGVTPDSSTAAAPAVPAGAPTPAPAPPASPAPADVPQAEPPPPQPPVQADPHEVEGSVEPPPPVPQPAPPAPATPPARPRPQPPREPGPVVPADASARAHADSIVPALYFRLGAGLGFPFGADVADSYEDRADDGRLRFSGYAFAIDLMAGAAVTPWLVLGGGVVSDQIVGGSVEDENEVSEDIERSLYFAVLGAFVDAYPSPPAGAHFQALVGLARLSPSTDLGENTALGFGAVLGIGYDFRVSKRWNLGVLARIAIAPMSMDPVDGQDRSPTLTEPSLLMTATYRVEPTL